jgi:hypothetical protein
VSNIEIELLNKFEDLVDVASMTMAQRQKAGLPTIQDESKVPEPRKARTKDNWKEEEQLCNSMLDTQKEI